MALLVVSLVSFACSSGTPQNGGGSETHFLSRCSESCPVGLTCECGVCTKPCSDAAICSALSAEAACVASAARVAQGRCAEAPSAFCDVSCLANSDCSSFGAGARCENGYCRDSDPPPPDGSSGTCEPSPLLPSDVAVLGDVQIMLSAFTAELEAAAALAGAIPDGGKVRDYADSGTSFLAENGLNIHGQYAMSRGEGPARIVVMNGGATDMLSNPCRDSAAGECAAIDAAASGAETLFTQMLDDGVEHLVYFFYPDVLSNAGLKEGIDELRPVIQNACGRSALPCHFLDLRPIFAGHNDYLTGADGLVFSDTGARVAAFAVWDLVEARCLRR